jgi:hypothetical protein
MENQNSFNTCQPQHSPSIKDQTYEKINKAKSVLTCVMFATEFVRDEMVVDNNTIYHALWAVDEYLDELEKLFQQI